ncbi:hypothetical protein [Pseudomonas syringae]|uniref:hypothetical protein n=1 Tax=Pseudomonas syringae TaxID=317 RepID=UPI000B1731B1|nr:hypothetical protein [Pseudomonas syringae]
MAASVIAACFGSHSRSEANHSGVCGRSSSTALNETEKDALIKARIGQGAYRDPLVVH